MQQQNKINNEHSLEIQQLRQNDVSIYKGAMHHL